MFHPNGLEIISNSEVWDMRTFQLLKNVDGLDRCQVYFNTAGDIMYALSLEQEDDDGDKYDTAFKTFDAHDYSNIATIETRRAVLGLSSSSNDMLLAVVENTLSPAQHEESVVRLYDVGRARADAEEEAEGGDAENDDDDDDDVDPEGSDGKKELFVCVQDLF